MIAVKLARDLVVGDIVKTDAFSPSWSWITRIEKQRPFGVLRIYLNISGYFEEVRPEELIVVDSSRRPDQSHSPKPIDYSASLEIAENTLQELRAEKLK